MEDFNLSTIQGLFNGNEDKQSHNVVVSLKKRSQVDDLRILLHIIQETKSSLEYIITRQSNQNSSLIVAYVEIRATQLQMETLTSKLKENECFYEFFVLSSINDDLTKSKSQIEAKKKNAESKNKHLIPKSIWDLDKLNFNEMKINKTSVERSDAEYKNKRQQIADLTYSFKHGDVIPRIKYADEEAKIWRQMYHDLSKLYKLHACREFQKAFALLEDECVYSPDLIPQLEDVSRFIKSNENQIKKLSYAYFKKEKSGFQMRPLADSLNKRDFLSCLAYRVFPAVQFVRHNSESVHSPVLDCISNYLGYVPLLLNRTFADFCQKIGLLSLGASDENITKLYNVYAFTAKFGLLKEGRLLKAYGGVLLSSYDELERSMSGEATLRDFDVQIAAIQSLDENGVQPVYFVAESLERNMQQLGEFGKILSAASDTAQYDPYTQSVEFGYENMNCKVNQMKKQFDVGFEKVLSMIEKSFIDLFSFI